MSAVGGMCQPGVYPTDLSEEEWAFVAPYLCLLKQDAPPRPHSLRAVFNMLRYMVRAGCPWRLLPNGLPPWQIVHQPAQRWLAAGVFEVMAHDLRMIRRLVAVQRHQRPDTTAFAVVTPSIRPERFSVGSSGRLLGSWGSGITGWIHRKAFTRNDAPGIFAGYVPAP